MRVRRTRGIALLAAAALQAALLPAVTATAEEHEPEVEVLVDGLRNPRHLAIDGDTLYVAEAGIGGEDCFAPEPEDPEFELCFGPTGRISSVDVTDPDPAATAVADGLPSLAAVEDPDEPVGMFAVGPHDVSMGTDGHLYVPIGLGASAADRDGIAEAMEEPMIEMFGTLQRIDLNEDPAEVSQVADLAAFEDANNPDGADHPDSNPYAVLAEADSVVVVDAGGNSLLRVPLDNGETPIGDVEVVAVFPPNPMPAPEFFGAPPGTMFPADPVPTTVIADNGGYVVGELGGFPFHPGAARIWTVNGELDLVSAGFSNVIDLAMGPTDGKLYVLEFTSESLLDVEFGAAPPTSTLVRYDPATGVREVMLADPLMFAAGLVFAADGTLYISNCGVCLDEGELQGHILKVSGIEEADPILYTTPSEAVTDEDQPVEIDVLENDSEGLELRDVVNRGNGAVLINTITYQPEAHFDGTDVLHYRACNEDGVCGIGEVTVTVNDLPTGRFDGEDRFETAVRVSRAAFPAGANTVVIARSHEYPDALAGSVLAAVAGAPILLTRDGELHPLVIEEINRLGATSAYILGGLAAIHQSVQDAIEAQTTVESTTRVAGQDRFETAVAVRDEVESLTGEPATAVYVAEGQHVSEDRGYPDVLSAAALAAHEVRPILLVTHGELRAPTRAALEAGVTVATVVGGPAAVSAQVAAEIDGIVDAVDRVGGTDRYHTSVLVAGRAIAAGLDPNLLWLATGRNWPDALAAGPAVALTGGILVLVDPTDLDRSPQVRQFLRDQRPFDDVDLLGGTAAISAAVEQQVRAELQ